MPSLDRKFLLGNSWPFESRTHLRFTKPCGTPTHARAQAQFFSVSLRLNASDMRLGWVPETRTLEDALGDKIERLRNQSHRYQTEIERIAREIEELNTRLSGAEAVPSEVINAQPSDQ